jgi:hypothetical protein
MIAIHEGWSYAQKTRKGYSKSRKLMVMKSIYLFEGEAMIWLAFVDDEHDRCLIS